MIHTYAVFSNITGSNDTAEFFQAHVLQGLFISTVLIHTQTGWLMDGATEVVAPRSTGVNKREDCIFWADHLISLFVAYA
jgi:hypothetical protein